MIAAASRRVHRRRRVGQQQLADRELGACATSACAKSASTPLRLRVRARLLDRRRLAVEPGHGRSSPASRPRSPACRRRSRSRSRRRPRARCRAAARGTSAWSGASRSRTRSRRARPPPPARPRARAGPTASAPRAGRRSAPRRRRSARRRSRQSAGTSSASKLLQRPPRRRLEPLAVGQHGADARDLDDVLADRPLDDPAGQQRQHPSSTSSRVSAGMRNAMRCMVRTANAVPWSGRAANVNGGWVGWW